MRLNLPRDSHDAVVYKMPPNSGDDVAKMVNSLSSCHCARPCSCHRILAVTGFSSQLILVRVLYTTKTRVSADLVSLSTRLTNTLYISPYYISITSNQIDTLDIPINRKWWVSWIILWFGRQVRHDERITRRGIMEDRMGMDVDGGMVE